MELECYPTQERPPEIVPGRPQRAWMDAFMTATLSLPAAEHGQHHRLGNSQCRSAFTAEWNGGPMQEDIKITPTGPYPDFHNLREVALQPG